MKTIINNCKIKHIETIVPQKVEKNIDLDFDAKTKEKLIKSTGIKQKHILSENESLLELYVNSGESSLNKLKWTKDSIDGVIVVSQSPEYQLPATSAILQDKLGLSTKTFAYDINMGCSGYVYGLYSAMSNLSASSGHLKRILLFVGDAISRVVHKKNKTNAFLFGDAVSCTAIEYDEKASPTPFILENDGKYFQNIIVEHGGLKNKINLSSFEDYTDDEGNINSKACLKMDGLSVMKYTMKEIPRIVDELLNFSKKEKKDIDYFCFHQANELMIKHLSTKMQINEKSPTNIENFGNTSGVSIPLLITDKKLNGSNTMLISFGVGMSLGNCIVDLSNSSIENY